MRSRRRGPRPVSIVSRMSGVFNENIRQDGGDVFALPADTVNFLIQSVQRDENSLARIPAKQIGFGRGTE